MPPSVKEVFEYISRRLGAALCLGWVLYERRNRE
jgi:hypothetical protein